MVMSTFRHLSCLTLVSATEGKDICCTSEKLSERAIMGRRRSTRGGEEEKVRRRRRKIARHSCGSENLPLPLPRQGCFHDTFIRFSWQASDPLWLNECLHQYWYFDN